LITSAVSPFGTACESMSLAGSSRSVVSVSAVNVTLYRSGARGVTTARTGAEALLVDVAAVGGGITGGTAAGLASAVPDGAVGSAASAAWVDAGTRGAGSFRTRSGTSGRGNHLASSTSTSRFDLPTASGQQGLMVVGRQPPREQLNGGQAERTVEQQLEHAREPSPGAGGLDAGERLVFRQPKRLHAVVAQAGKAAREVELASLDLGQVDDELRHHATLGGHEPFSSAQEVRVGQVRYIQRSHERTVDECPDKRGPERK
jgi:hypothetical protein